MKIPADWLDVTIGTLTGPKEGEFEHGIWITADPRPRTTSLDALADHRVALAEGSGQGWRLLQRRLEEIRPGLKGIRLDLRWCPSEELRLYRTEFLAAWKGTVYTISTLLTKKSKATKGPAILKTMRTLRPAGFTAPGGTAAGAGAKPPAFLADLYSLDPGGEWRDTTFWSLVEPDGSTYRRSLVATARPMDQPPESLEAFARGEIEAAGEGVPDYSLLEERDVQAADGEPARLAVTRRLKPGTRMPVRQGSLFAHRKGRMYIATVTAADEIRGEDWQRLTSVLLSFTAKSESLSGPALAPGSPADRRGSAPGSRR